MGFPLLWIGKFLFNLLPDIIGIVSGHRSTTPSSGKPGRFGSLLPMALLAATSKQLLITILFGIGSYLIFSAAPTSYKSMVMLYNESKAGVANDRCEGSMTIKQQEQCNEYKYILGAYWGVVWMIEFKNELASGVNTVTAYTDEWNKGWTMTFIWIFAIIIGFVFVCRLIFNFFEHMNTRWAHANIDERERRLHGVADNLLPAPVKNSLEEAQRMAQYSQQFGSDAGVGDKSLRVEETS